MQQSFSSAVPNRTSRATRVYRFRAFYLTILCISLFTVASLGADWIARYRHGTQYGAAQRRALDQLDVTRLVKRDEECRLVHHAEDKCTFIKHNCADEEAGLFSYLSLYYCSLPKAQPVAFIILSLWLALLFSTIGIAASEFFCPNLSTIASILGMSESMAGVTFLAFGNGSPDVFSTFAAMSSHSGSLAVGELIGAAVFITTVVAGSMAMVREFKVGKKTFMRDVGFFIIASSFTMYFLADGALHLWECCVMVGFYLFYVVVVVAWHWYLGRRRRRREREAAARGHYLAMANEEIEVTEEDGDDEDAPAGERRYRDEEDFRALERGSSPGYSDFDDDESDEEGEERMHLAAEMTNNMRVTKAKGNRRNTLIRPSLVGALEFRSVLSSLQKAQGSSSRPIHLRRYSDDTTAINQQDEPGSESEAHSDNASSVIVTPAKPLLTPSKADPSARTRAVSMNDAATTRPTDPAAFSVANVPDVGIVAATPTFPRNFDISGPGIASGPPSISGPVPASPTISISPPPSTSGQRDADRTASHDRLKRDTLTIPEDGFPGARHLRVDFLKGHEAPDSSNDSRKLRSRNLQRPRLQIPTTSSRDSSRSRTISPISPFPMYTDSPLPISSQSSRAPSLLLPDPTLTPESLYLSHEDEFHARPIQWWPYRYLPSPQTLGSTLFPLLYTWQEKNVWDKFIAVVSAPTIFLLAITLPVVEAESQDDGSEDAHSEAKRTSTSRTRAASGPVLVPDSPSLETDPQWHRHRRGTDDHEPPASSLQQRAYSQHSTAAVAVSVESLHDHSHSRPVPTKQGSLPPLEEQPSGPAPSLSPQDWNRWLIAVQIFTAPFFVVLIVWANTADASTKLLVQMILYSLLASLVVFAILISTTTPSKPPKYRFILCFLGFVVAIAWISTIANEVVGVLKAFGVILGISDAILGLTIFAVGNSLGDLVADITVARLGYPVMALSACFGGPMLNILLGIGLGGLYMTIKDANYKHAKHPGKNIKYKPYEIEVSRTLIISAITLLITLVGLLIAVPWNKWIMSKRIGYGLIALWSISTAINLLVELGVFGNTSTIQ